MAQVDKRLQRMRENLRDWRIEELRSIADKLGIDWLHDGGSHVIFQSQFGQHLSVPAKRPIKPVYIKKILEMIESVMENDHERA